MSEETLYRSFEEYSTRYQSVAMTRRDGIVELRLHSGEGSLQWGLAAHGELTAAFLDVGNDADTRVVILTGTGADFSGPLPTGRWQPATTAREWDVLLRDGRRLQDNLLNIEVPVIAAVNGPAYRHSELPLLSDIVLASTTAVFGDFGHYHTGLVPGDGIHAVYSMLLGPNRSRYHLLTGAPISAQKAEEWGLVSEVLAPEDLLPRAWALAAELARQPPLQLRYTRMILTHELRRRMQDVVGYGLALEGLALLDAEK